MKLENQVAIVTGGARGIGKGVASRLAAEGAVVVIADIQAPASTATEAETGMFLRGRHEAPEARWIPRVLVTRRLSCSLRSPCE